MENEFIDGDTIRSVMTRLLAIPIIVASLTRVRQYVEIIGPAWPA